MYKERNTGYQKNIFSATLFALALLVVVVSCPLKRLLINNSNSQTSVAFKSNQISNKQYLGNFYSNDASCFTDKYNKAILQADSSRHKKGHTPFFTIHIFNETGFFIHSFLDGIKTDYIPAPGLYYSSLPLFLQHRSLLI